MDQNTATPMPPEAGRIARVRIEISVRVYPDKSTRETSHSVGYRFVGPAHRTFRQDVIDTIGQEARRLGERALRLNDEEA